MRTTITIEYISVGGINPDRPDLNRKQVLDALEKSMDKICKELEKNLSSKTIKTKIVHISE